MKELILKQIKKTVKKLYPAFKGQVSLEYPPDSKMGDLGFPCFELAKLVKKSPHDIAEELAEELKSNEAIDKVKVVGPYLNFFLNKEKLWQQIFRMQNVECRMQNRQRVMLEFSSPNTNKPLHLGHLRNISIGDAMSNLLESQGHKTTRASLVNDRGIHICKSMLAYQKVKTGEWTLKKLETSNKKLGAKGDHIVGDYYVLFSQKEKENPEIIKEAQKMLGKWESGDKDTVKLWKKLNRMVLAGHNETYKKLEVKFDKTYFESQEYEAGKKIILGQLKKGKCYKRKDGAVEIDLTKYGLDKKVLLRPDGTSVYITQDIGLAVNRQKNLKLDKIVYVVANEQDYHFKVLFKILQLFGCKWSKNLYHLSYAMVNLPTGKMKSREGTVVDADDIIDEMSELARQEIKKRAPKISQRELVSRAQTIGLSAMKFYLLKHSPNQTITYNPKESISFEGATGPYLQYTYARIQSILRKHQETKNKKTIINYQLPVPSRIEGSIINYQLLDTEEEWSIGKLLSRFNESVTESAAEYNPSKFCAYLLELASAFNTFYHQHPVLKAKDQNLVIARLALTSQVASVLKSGLSLLGIKVVEKM